jgi:hypothetical protein
MPEFLQPILANLTSSGLNLLAALAILVVGWIIALIIGAVVRGIFNRVQFDDKIAQWMAGGDAPPVDTARLLGRAAYYIAMLFVLVAFFQRLGLTMITQPINAFLTQIFQAAPAIIGAGLIILLAWIVASVLKFIVTRALEATNLDERLRDRAGLEEEETSFSQSIGNAAFWFVFLLFLPALLDTLGMNGLVAPVQGMFDELLAIIPNILGAGLILLVGWFIARIVRQVLTNVLAAAGVDHFSKRIGLDTALGEQRFSALIGTIVHALIMIQVVIAALDTLAIESISAPAKAMLTAVWNGIPGFVGAIVVLAVSFYIGRWISQLVANLLAGIGFDRVLKWVGLGGEPVEGQRTPSEIVGSIVLVGVMLFAVVESAEMIGFNVVTDLVTQVIAFAGQAIVAVVIFGLGLYIANLARSYITSSGMENAKLLGQLSRIAILALVIAMTLGQLGVASEIVNLAFGLLIGAVAVAIALAFGLGGRDIAARKVEGWLAAVSEDDSKE